MVGVEVGDDDAPDRRRQPAKDCFPEFPDVVQPVAGVDDGPGRLAIVFVFEQLQVDMVEGKGQRHAQPVDAGSDFESFTGGGQGLMGEIEQHTVGY